MLLQAKGRWRGGWAVFADRQCPCNDTTPRYINGEGRQTPFTAVAVRWCSATLSHPRRQHEPRIGTSANSEHVWSPRWMGNVKTAEWLTCGYWRYWYLSNLWALDNSTFLFWIRIVELALVPQAFGGLYLFCHHSVWCRHTWNRSVLFLWEDSLIF